MKGLPLLMLALLPLAAAAQVPPPGAPTATRSGTGVPPPVVAPAPVRPADPAVPQVRPATPLPAPRPLAVPRSSGPIPSTGPAQVPAPPASSAPAKVYDRDGRIVPGLRPAGPNRVLDSRTGRYHDSVPTTNGQQIKP